MGSVIGEWLIYIPGNMQSLRHMENNSLFDDDYGYKSAIYFTLFTIG